MLHAYQLPLSSDEIESQKPEVTSIHKIVSIAKHARDYHLCRRRTLLGLVLLVLVNICAFLTVRGPWRETLYNVGMLNLSAAEFRPEYEATLVMTSMSDDDVTWVEHFRPQWSKKIYVTNNKTSILSVPKNKGREAMVYLSYIIDHYHELAPVTIFHHAARYQWHNDDPLYDGLRMLARLQLTHVLAQGYVNLRCVWTLGCPAEIHPIEEQLSNHSSGDATGTYYAKAFSELFPALPLPERVGVSCCAQFAVSKETITQRPLNDYVRYREWLLNTELSDDISGRVLEYSWHIIFGKEAVFCPDAKSCYCQVYGLCGLTCETTGTCSSQYTLARYATLPTGWPVIGWDGETRNVTKLREDQAGDYSPAWVER